MGTKTTKIKTNQSSQIQRANQWAKNSMTANDSDEAWRKTVKLDAWTSMAASLFGRLGAPYAERAERVRP
jgi:hypothetical protein